MKNETKQTARRILKLKRAKPFKDDPKWKLVSKQCPQCKLFKFVLPDYGLRWVARGGKRVRDTQSQCKKCRSEGSVYYKRDAMKAAR